MEHISLVEEAVHGDFKMNKRCYITLIIVLLLFLICPWTIQADDIVATSCNNGVLPTATELTPAYEAGNWRTDGVGWEVSGGTLVVNNTSGSSVYIYSRSGDIVAGKKYRIVATFSAISGGNIYAKLGNTSLGSYPFRAENLTRTLVVTATNSSSENEDYRFRFSAENGVTGTLSSLSVKEITSDIQDKVDSANSGDTIYLPDDDCYIDSTVVLPSTKTLTIRGGYGGGTTTITHTGTTAFMLLPTDGILHRIRNISFVSDGENAIVVYGSALGSSECMTSWCNNAFAIHNNTFAYSRIDIKGLVSGVIAKNTFTHTETYTCINGAIGRYSSGNNMDGGTYLFTEDTDLGGEHFVFVEGNTFDMDTYVAGSTAYDQTSGGRAVYRYNTNINIGAGGHGAMTGYERGIRAWEVYNNWGKRTTSGSLPLQGWKGGTGVYYNNFGSVHSDITEIARMICDRIPDGYGTDRNPWSYPVNGTTDYRCREDTTIVCDEDADCAEYCVGNKMCIGSSGDGDAKARYCSGPVGGFYSTYDCGTGNYCVNIDGTYGDGYIIARDMPGVGKTNATTGEMSIEPILIWNNKRCVADGGDCDWNDSSEVRILTYSESEGGHTYMKRNLSFCDKTCVGGTDAGKGCDVDGDCAGGGTCSVATAQPTICGGVTLTYTPSTCPHSLMGSGNCDSTTYGAGGYKLTNNSSMSIGSGASLSIGSGAVMTLQ